MLERGGNNRERLALKKLKSLSNNFESLNKKSCLPALFHTVRLSYSNAVPRLVGPSNGIYNPGCLGTLEEIKREDALC